MNGKKKPDKKKHEIGSTTYLITHSFQKNAKEDAAMKMEKIVRNDAERLLRDTTLTLYHFNPL